MPGLPAMAPATAAPPAPTPRRRDRAGGAGEGHRDGGDAVQDVHRRRAFSGRAVPRLAGVVAAPEVEAAGRGQGAGVALPCGVCQTAGRRPSITPPKYLAFLIRDSRSNPLAYGLGNIIYIASGSAHRRHPGPRGRLQMRRGRPSSALFLVVTAGLFAVALTVVGACPFLFPPGKRAALSM